MKLKVTSVKCYAVVRRNSSKNERRGYINP